MAEEIIPDVQLASDVEIPSEIQQEVEVLVDADQNVEEPKVNYLEKNLQELVSALEEFMKNEDRIRLPKEVDAIKAAFYKRLSKDKAEATEEATIAELEALEAGFKATLDAYRRERGQYNAQIEKEREENLRIKLQIIADLKALVENQSDVKAAFPAFREIQERWRNTGPVPVQKYKDINESYQLSVEQFYDLVQIDRELRDLDFKKNYEAKLAFCEQAEQLAESDNVVAAFRELQVLHERWKELGPVEKQYRESIWDRFKAATAVINKKYQAYFEGQKSQQTANLQAKTALCEKIEAIVEKALAQEESWADCTKEVEEIQKQWKTIGFASKKENQKIYERFRAACDKFFAGKRDFYLSHKDNINANLEKRIALCEQAEALKTSTDWKNTANKFIELQKQWQEIGTVPRKKGEQVWKRFRAACDEFFAERDKNNDLYRNLKAKQKLIAEVREYELGSADDAAAAQDFEARWQEIGHVPFREKDKVQKAFREAMEKFPYSRSRKQRYNRPVKSEKEILVGKYNQLEQDIVTYENNIGFFAMSKNSEPLIRQMQERIAQAKEELKALEVQIRQAEEANQE